MCGIVGYVGRRPCRDLLIAGLEKLEYRGYDSAGLSLLDNGHIDSVRAVGNLANLRAAVAEPRDEGAVAVAEADATIGLAHTRWATHGRVTEENAHPHSDEQGEVHIVLNGIVENHSELRRELLAEGHEFSSETDAEIVAHLIERHYDGDLTAAVRAAFAELRGHYAFVAMHVDHPELLVGARKECPLVIGLGEGETFLASAIPAFLRETRSVMQIENGEIVTITPDGVDITAADGNPAERELEEVTWDEDAAERGGYPTFMMKEIHEQPDAVAETITDRLPGDRQGRPQRADADPRAGREGPPHRHRRLRDLLPRGPRRPLRDRDLGAGPGRDGHRLRVPLPRPRDRPRRPRHRDHPVGRDGRHARGDAARPRARRPRARDHQRDGQPGDPRRRLRPLHPRRPRDRRRGDQDLHQPGRRDLPARASGSPRRAARSTATGSPS